MVNPGPVPHVGGPIVPACCPTVLVGNSPVARTTDKALCVPVAAKDAIVTGSPTVHIGGRKLAARIGDNTAHGGVIVMGLPTVLIGNGSFPFAVKRLNSGNLMVGNKMFITGTPEFMATVVADLATIAQTPSARAPMMAAGLETLNNIDLGRHLVAITETSKGNACAYGNKANAQRPAVGSTSAVRYNLNSEPFTAADPTVRRPVDVGLHHELSHSDHMSQGTVDMSPATTPGNPHMEEENTINQDNLYRDSRQIPRRTNHGSV
jgi:uncharacterized Zn-binding protein involved in type VI secretion